MPTSAVTPILRREVEQPQDWARLRAARIKHVSELRAIEPAWRALAEHAIEPNVLYEPSVMLPALEEARRRVPLEIYIVYADFLHDSRLVAFVPIERMAGLVGLGSSRRQLLRQRCSALYRPLLDPEFGSAAMTTLLRSFLRRN
jgi:hypothetical protein